MWFFYDTFTYTFQLNRNFSIYIFGISFLKVFPVQFIHQHIYVFKMRDTRHITKCISMRQSGIIFYIYVCCEQGKTDRHTAIYVQSFPVAYPTVQLHKPNTKKKRLYFLLATIEMVWHFVLGSLYTVNKTAREQTEFLKMVLSSLQ